MVRVPLEKCRARLLLACAAAVATFGLVAEGRAQGGEGARPAGKQVLPLVTEKVERPDEAKTEIRYWWKNATEPNWTGTDRALRSALGDRSAELMEPSGDVRISRIYRTPELSFDNAAALASVVGARRILVGEVGYEVRTDSVLPRANSVHADATLQLVDVGSSEPSIVQTIRFERTAYGSKSVDALLAEARKRVAVGASRLLERILATASGPVGIESKEGFLVFHELQKGEALDRIRAFLDQLDVVDHSQVRWASNGLVAVEVRADGAEVEDATSYAARTLVNHEFDGMRVRRRQKSLAGNLLEFSVHLADGFGETNRKRQEGEREER